MQINTNFTKLFNYDREDLEKRNISKILPAYLAQYHDSFIKRYLETAQEHIINAPRIVFGLSSVGFIFPLMIYVKIIPNLDCGIRFIALLKKLSKKHSFYSLGQNDKLNTQISSIQCDSEGRVFAISKQVISKIIKTLKNNKHNLHYLLLQFRL